MSADLCFPLLSLVFDFALLRILCNFFDDSLDQELFLLIFNYHPFYLLFLLLPLHFFVFDLFLLLLVVLLHLVIIAVFRPFPLS